MSTDPASLEKEIASLKGQLQVLEARKVTQASLLDQPEPSAGPSSLNGSPETGTTWPMSLLEYKRYGRQMILDDFGIEAQLALKKASILVVGAGGLGCPALLYLSGVGVGHLGIVDHDTVEISNLHRQVLHTEHTVGLPKAESAKLALQARNSSIRITTHTIPFTPSTIPLLDLSSYDLILDCTDNPSSRYLLSDACVYYNKTVVSGAAIRTDGQVNVWNLPPAGESGERGPCYRCLFPEVQDGGAGAGSSGRCEDEGVLGVVTGLIGTLMAGEAIKLLIGKHEHKPSLLLFSLFSSPQFRHMKIRGRKPHCPGCGEGSRKRWEEGFGKGSDGGESFTGNICGVGQEAGIVDDRVSVRDLKAAIERSLPQGERWRRHVILDVRPRTEFGICSIRGSTNIPFTAVLKDPSKILQSLSSDQAGSSADASGQETEPDLPEQRSTPIYIICRRGNDSLLASRALRAAASSGSPPKSDTEPGGGDRGGGPGVEIMDVVGGLRAWSKVVDPDFPVY